MVQWAIELSQFDVEYRPRTAIKAQALADFIAEFTAPEHEDNQEELWTIHTDGSPTQKKGGAGITITSPKEDVLKYRVQLKFLVTNNEAEYEAILMGLRIAQAFGVKNILLRNDSQLVIGQVKGDFEAKKARMQKYLKLTNQLVSNFDRVEFVQIPRDENAETNEVARSASVDDQEKVTNWRLEEQNSPSIEEFQSFPMHAHFGWTSPILSYLKDGQLPPNPKEAKKIQKRAARFMVPNDKLYKRGFSQPYLRCVEEEKVHGGFAVITWGQSPS